MIKYPPAVPSAAHFFCVLPSGRQAGLSHPALHSQADDREAQVAAESNR
jgi:hypothetical protein